MSLGLQPIAHAKFVPLTSAFNKQALVLQCWDTYCLSLIPSAGSRACLGEHLARTELFIFLTSLLRAFTFQLPDGVKEVNTEPLPGSTVHPHPYKICAVARSAAMHWRPKKENWEQLVHCSGFFMSYCLTAFPLFPSPFLMWHVCLNGCYMSFISWSVASRVVEHSKFCSCLQCAM